MELEFWRWQHSTQQNPSHLFISEKVTPVTLTVTTVNGCTTDPRFQQSIRLRVIANAGPDTIALYSQPFQLHGSGGATFQWSPGIYLNNPTIANPVATLSEDQIFTLTVITSQGCIGSDGVKITVVKYFDVFVPTGFTPNKMAKTAS
ncbi:MAG: hypothetical protein IPP93_07875 [Chitinophagaceae bacterium]|nr:hypothetical protein [Chitinophagaceae bacterium]